MQTVFEKFVLPFAALPAIVLTGCASSDVRTAGRAHDDRELKSRVEEALKEEPVYKFNDVRVSAYNGVVQLSGWANSDEQKARAADIARGIEGVHEVANNISLKLTPTSYPPRSDTNNPARVDAPIRSETAK